MVVNHLVKRLTEGLDTHTRKDGRVFRLHAGDRTIGEVVVGDETLRVNVKELTDDAELIAQAEGLEFTGRSKAWFGGIRVTDENINGVVDVLHSIARDAVADRQRTRSLRDAVSTIENAKNLGALDEEFERELREVLGRRRPVSRRAQPKKRARRAHALA